MEGPFQRKPFLGNKFGLTSRFSNGEWPVFYTAIGRTTAEKESTHHYGRKAAGDATARRAVHYSIVRIEFSGEIVDLQPKLTDWPDLVTDDYAFCNGLGREAHTGGLGGLLSPSARNPGGTTVPALMPGTLSGPMVEATATLTFDRGSTKVEVKPLP
jgi:RES domain